jgi:5-formyltetrahydrofolate cyclo-ligase
VKLPGEIREEIWTALIKEHAAAYPLPPYGHNPNFKGSGEAAALLIEKVIATALVKSGDTVLSCPDYVLKPVRKGLLEAGVNVIVPAKFGKDYKLLEASKVASGEGSSISGAEKVGVTIKELPELAMTFVACVAITKTGHYFDKGYGFHLPESTLKLPSATIVHPLQVYSTQIVEGLESRLRVRVYATPEKVFVMDSNSEQKTKG